MKNNVKKVLALVVALTLALAMALPAFAAEDDYYKGEPSITVDTNGNASLEGRSFAVYQIFIGELGTTEGQLGNIQWGQNATPEVIAAIKGALNLVGEVTAAQVAEAIRTPELAKAVAEAVNEVLEKAGNPYALLPDDEKDDGKYTIDVDAGYYLVVDTTEVDGEKMVKSSVMLEVAGPVTMEIKTTTPTLDKVILEENDEGVEEAKNGTTAQIGDHIKFQLTGTIPENYADFEKYYYVFHDTLSDGLTFDGEDYLKVTIDGTEVTGYEVVTEDLGDACSFHVVFEDLFKVTPEITFSETSKVVVTYTATLNSQAELADENDGNINKAKLEYSNDPYWNGEGDEPTGDTPEDEVYVYTFGIELDKYADTKPDPTALDGAEFKLYKKDAAGNKTYYKLDDEGNVTWVDDEGEGDTFTSKDGKFVIDGLDVGEYWLTETKSPAGYNKVPDFMFTISAKLDKDGKFETKEDENYVNPELTVVDDAEGVTVKHNGSLNAEYRFQLEVLDTVATTLPGTGGIGTTIFYTVGAIVVAAALAYLFISNVQKKRATRG